MDPLTQMYLVGQGIKLFGQFQANMSQASAAAENAAFYEEQANMASLETDRKLSIAAKDYAYQYGNIVSSYSTSGLDVGGGSLVEIAGAVAARRIEELSAIKKQGQLSMRLAMSRAQRARSEADMLSSPAYNMLQVGTTLLAGGAAYSKGTRES